MKDIPNQTVDIEVSKRKFKDELGIFINLQESYRKNGIILLNASFPDIEILFMAIKINPTPVAFAARINFENYDLEPPSVKFINPFTGELLKATQVATQFLMKIGTTPEGIPIPQGLLQAETPDSIPFLCFRGIREYHNHPAHTGDSWLLYRKESGIGTLIYIIDQLYHYGSEPLKGYSVNANVNFTIGHILSVDGNNLPE